MAIGYSNKKELIQHYGHEIEIAYYGDKNNPNSVTIECLDCFEVLIDCEEEEEDYVAYGAHDFMNDYKN